MNKLNKFLFYRGSHSTNTFLITGLILRRAASKFSRFMRWKLFDYSEALNEKLKAVVTLEGFGKLSMDLTQI